MADRRAPLRHLAACLALAVAAVGASAAGEDGHGIASAGPTIPALATPGVTPAATPAPTARVVVGALGGGHAGDVLARPGGGMVLTAPVKRTTLTGADGSTIGADQWRYHGITAVSPGGHLDGLRAVVTAGDDTVTQYDAAVIDGESTVHAGSAGFGFESHGFPHGGWVEWVRHDGTVARRRTLRAFAELRSAQAFDVAATPTGEVFAHTRTQDSVDGIIPLDDVGMEVQDERGEVLARLPGARHLVRFGADGSVRAWRTVDTIGDMASTADGGVVLITAGGGTLRELGPDLSVRWRSEALTAASDATVWTLDDGDLLVRLVHQDPLPLTTPLGSVELPAAAGTTPTSLVRLDRAGGPPLVARLGGATVGVRGDGAVAVAGDGGAVLRDAAGTLAPSTPGRQRLALLGPDLVLRWVDELPTSTSTGVGFDGAGNVVAGTQSSATPFESASTSRRWMVYDGTPPCAAVTLGAPAAVTSTGLAVTATVSVAASGTCTSPDVPIEARLLDADGVELGRVGLGIGPTPPGATASLAVQVPVPSGTPAGPLTLEVAAPWHGGAVVTAPVDHVPPTPTTTTTRPPTTTTVPAPGCAPVSETALVDDAIPYPELALSFAPPAPPCRRATGPAIVDVTTDADWHVTAATPLVPHEPIPGGVRFTVRLEDLRDRRVDYGHPRIRLEEPRWWTGATTLTVRVLPQDPTVAPSEQHHRLGASGTAVVRGSLRGPGGEDPAAGVIVSAYAAGDHWRSGRHTTTDADGRYELVVPADAPVVVRAVDPQGRFRTGWLTGSGFGEQPAVGASFSTWMAANEVYEVHAELAARPTAAVAGRATEAGTATGGLVVVAGAYGVPPHWSSSWVPARSLGHLRSTTTATDGSYRLDHLPPGDVALMVLDPRRAAGRGWQRLASMVVDRRVVAVTPEGTTTVDIAMG